jgi:putative DNA primase/helicase
MTTNPHNISDDLAGFDDYIDEQVEKVKPRTKKSKSKKANGEGKVVVLDPAKYDDRRTKEEDDWTDVHGDERIVVLPPPSEPMAVARVFVRECLVDGALTLRHWRGGWWMWKRTHWIEVDEETTRAALYNFTDKAVCVNGMGIPVPWSPNRRKIIDLRDALAAVCVTPTDLDQPCWLDGREPAAMVSVANGLLEINLDRLVPHSPLYFNQTSVPFNYAATAPQPERWLEFLRELWPDEEEAIAALQQWFGYVISGRTDLHKILLMVGPTRAGKGVIARILTALVGRKNIAGPTLNSLGTNFGLSPLIGKPLAVISDARFAGRDASVVVERLLSISGEDSLTIDIKYRTAWTGRLPSRLHIISNEIPKLGDASAAIVGRILLLPLQNSWLNKEDYELEPALQAELPGILNWALTGLSELVANGNRFTRVESAEEAINTMRDLASPIGAFVRERCQLGPDFRIAVDSLYGDFKSWAEDNGHSRRSKATFGRDLHAAYPRIVKVRSREGEERRHDYVGIALRS